MQRTLLLNSLAWLENLGMTYNVLPFAPAGGLPSVAEMLAYKAVLWYTGENYAATIGLTLAQQDQMVDYLNSGGRLIAMGQDLASTIGEATPNDCAQFFYCYRLGADYVQDSISGFDVPTNPVMAAHTAPAALGNMAIDLSAPRFFLDSGRLSGANEVPAVDSVAGGSFSINYNVDKANMSYRVTVTTTEAITVFMAHIHRGDAGVNGPVEWGITPPGFTETVVISTTPLVLTGVIENITAEQAGVLLANGFYFNVHTRQNPSGEVRGQIEPAPYFGQVIYVDEIDNVQPSDNPNPVPPGFGDSIISTPLFAYAGLGIEELGIVGTAKDDQPSLERPGTAYSGRSVYLTFGLEGINPPPADPTTERSADASFVSREQLLGTLMTWLDAKAGTAIITQTAAISTTGWAVFEAGYAGGTAVEYRWDFGDGSAYTTSLNNEAGHQYVCAEAGNTYTVRVEVTDSLGMVALGSGEVDVTDICVTEPETIKSLYLPVIQKE